MSSALEAVLKAYSVNHKSTAKDPANKQLTTKVESFEGDMVGTEILTPLLAILKVDRHLKYLLSIFLLTDEDAFNTSDMIKTVTDYDSTNISRSYQRIC